MPSLLHTVIENFRFARDAEKVGLTEDEITAMVTSLANNPDQGDEIQGSGGVRKVRFAGRGKGKSGGYRVMIAYVEKGGPVFLLALLSKGDRENFNDREIASLKMVTTAIKQARRAKKEKA